jgi:LacI family transcriptional regulator
MKKKKIAFCLQWSFLSHCENILGALDYAAQADHWDIFRDHGDPIIFPKHLLSSGCDGIIANIHSESSLEVIKQTERPTVRVDNFIDLQEIPGVFPDDKAVGTLAANYFLSRHFTEFAVVTYPEEPFGQLRAEAFKNTLAPHRCNFLEISDRWDLNRFNNTIEDFLHQLPPSTALFAVNDDLATIIIYHARKCGIKVPEDLSVLGAGNNEFVCRKAMVPLSSINLPERECGYLAAQMLDDIIDGKPRKTKTLPPINIASRLSTDYFAVDDKLVARALRCIHAKRNNPLSIANLAAELAVNRRTLERRFRQIMKISPLEEVMRMRMSRAKRMLQHTQKQIIEIAHAAGFPDLKSMETQFNNRENMTPEDFRKRTDTTSDAKAAAV